MEELEEVLEFFEYFLGKKRVLYLLVLIEKYKILICFSRMIDFLGFSVRNIIEDFMN